MKVIAKVIALYITTLLLFPCSDENMFIDDQQAMVQQTNMGDQDICTPFCICQCCRTAVEEMNAFNWATSDIKPIDKWTFFAEQKPRASKRLIWQPPKLV